MYSLSFGLFILVVVFLVFLRGVLFVFKSGNFACIEKY